MPRIKNQEIIRRADTQSRLSNTPDLAVHADQDASRGYQGLSSVAVGILGKVSMAYAGHKAEQNARLAEQSELEGATERTRQDATGQPVSTAEELAERNAAYLRGYRKTDGVLRLRDSRARVLEAAANKEPGESIDDEIAAELGSILNSPDYQDPEVLKVLQPTVAQVVTEIKAAHKQRELKEIFERTEENLSALVEEGIKDGSILSVEGIQRFRDTAAQPEYGAFDKQEADALLSKKFALALASGDHDTDKLLELLKAPLPDGSQGIYHRPEHAQVLENSARAGKAERERREDERFATLLAQAEMQWQADVSKGVMNPAEVDKRLRELGIAPESEPKLYQGTLRYWNNQHEAEMRRREAAAERARAERLRRQQAMAGNFFELSNSQLNKHFSKAWQQASTQQERAAVIRSAAEAGAVILPLQAMLQRTAPGHANYQNAARLMHSLRRVNPTWADRMAGSAAVSARLQQAHSDLNVHGLSLAEHERRFALTPDQKEVSGLAFEAAKRHGDSKEMKEARGGYHVATNGQPRTLEERARIDRTLRAVVEATPNIDPAFALRAAVGRVESQYETINGQRVFAGNIRPQMVPAIETVTRGLAQRAGLDPAKVHAEPVPGESGRWYIVNSETRLPVTTPESKGVMSFDPRLVSVAHARWQGDAHAARERARVASTNAILHVRQLPKTNAHDFDKNAAIRILQSERERERLPQNIRDTEAALRRAEEQGATFLANSIRERLASQRMALDALKASAGGRDVVPADFLQYIEQQN